MFIFICFTWNNIFIDIFIEIPCQTSRINEWCSILPTNINVNVVMINFTLIENVYLKIKFYPYYVSLDQKFYEGYLHHV